MDFDFDSSAILYALGAVLGIAALVYFGAEVVLALSPTVKALLLLLGFVAFLAVGIYTSVQLFNVIAYSLAGASYVVSVGYVITRFRTGPGVTFLALGASSVLFIALGYLIRERGVDLTGRQTTAVVLAAAIIGAGFVAGDALGAEPTYTLELQPSVNVTTGDDVRVGTLLAHNGFVFSRPMDVPRYSACLYTADRRLPARVQVDRRSSSRPYDLLYGGETRRMPVRLHVPLEIEDHEGDDRPPQVDLGEVPVEQADSCPPASAVTGQKIVVVPGRVDDWLHPV